MAYSDEVLADNPHAYYKLDEGGAGTFADTTGISSVGTQTGTLQRQQPGPPVGGYSILSQPAVDGGGFVSGLLNASIDITAGSSIMVEIWIKWNHSATVGSSEVFAFLPSTFNYAVWIRAESGPPQRAHIGFNTWNDDAFGVNALRGDLMSNWAMLNLAFKEGDRSACRLWINAVEQSPLTEMNGSGDGGVEQFDLDFYIGAGAGPAFAFDGYMAHCSVYDHWLDQTRIDAHYAWAVTVSKKAHYFERTRVSSGVGRR